MSLPGLTEPPTTAKPSTMLHAIRPRPEALVH